MVRARIVGFTQQGGYRREYRIEMPKVPIKARFVLTCFVNYSTWLAADLQPGAVVLVDDCHHYDGQALGKGTLLAEHLSRLGIAYELLDTEPGYRMLKATMLRN